MIHLSWETLALVLVTGYAASVVFTLLSLSRPALCCMVSGLLCNLHLFTERYCTAWPMLPMHLGLAGVSLMLAVITLCCWRQQERLPLLLLLLFLSLSALFFPKDFYLPLLRSISPWAHLFFVSGIFARSLFLFAGVRAVVVWRRQDSAPALHAVTGVVVCGYLLLTLSMFSGEIWSYLGWGTPIVWHDAAITALIAIWFYWSCFLHLHYLRGWQPAKRVAVLVCGCLLTLLCTVLPDAGPFRWIL